MSSSTVIGTLYAAEKYNVTDLVELCRDFLQFNITEGTVCDIMENARIFNMTNLFAKCREFILQSEYFATNIFESSGFLWCSRDCMASLIKDDKLPLQEEIIYQSLIRWAEHKCKEENNYIPDPAQMRNCLGNLIFHVRFPLMSFESFWKNAGENNILSAEEKSQISRLIAGNVVKNAVFSNTPRRGEGILIPIMKDVNDSTFVGVDCSGYSQIIYTDFEVNKPIFLLGLELYGSAYVPYTYNIEVDIMSWTQTILVHLPLSTITKSTKIFEVDLDPCKILPNKRYRVLIKMNGPCCHKRKCHDRVIHGDYIFQFYESKGKVPRRQISGLLCFLPG